MLRNEVNKKAMAMMSTLLRYLNKPEYLFQPATVARKLAGQSSTSEVSLVRLPWGISIEVDTGETIGHALKSHGLFEVAVVEAIFRLVEPADLILDVGANIGFMSAAAAVCHPHVSVIAFEPHPILFERLSRNIETWAHERPELRNCVRPMKLAVSDSLGMAALHLPDVFQGNQGTASLVEAKGGIRAAALQVACTTLDEILTREDRVVGLMKIDVEGHEMAVLRGGHQALARRQIRDVVFEDHDLVDSEVRRLLTDYGYKIYFLGKLPWGPKLWSTADAAWAASLSFDSPNFLATLEPARTEARMASRGYRCIA